MDQAGIEPASESPSLEASPITANLLTFPPCRGDQQPRHFSSFIIRTITQSLVTAVSRNHDASDRKYGYNRVTSCTQAATATVLLSAFNFMVRLLTRYGPRMASPTSKPPSKPVLALTGKSEYDLFIFAQGAKDVNYTVRHKCVPCVRTVLTVLCANHNYYPKLRILKSRSASRFMSFLAISARLS